MLGFIEYVMVVAHGIDRHFSWVQLAAYFEMDPPAVSQHSREIEIRRIGRQLRLLREKSGRTLAQVAQAAGVSQRALRELEAGRTNPSLATVVSIADVLGVTLDELVGAARRNLPDADYTSSPAASETSISLTRQLPNPRMRARIVQLDSRSGADPELPSAAVFGHVLGGGVAVSLEGEETGLRQGDSFHAQAGVLRGWRGQMPSSRLLVVEAVAEDTAGPRESSEQETG
jgi:transcriptional regulator with XRE-family HTH domain